MSSLDAALSRLPQLELRHVPAEGWAQALAQQVAVQLQQALSARGRAVLAVSGGRSPIAFFQSLSRLPLNWSQVVVVLVDERCVPPKHAASNALLVRTHLLQEQAAAATLLPLVPDDAPLAMDPQQLAQQADEALRALGPADVMVLGMGADGHTASLFPGAAELPAALDASSPRACVALTPQPLPPEAPYPRITQTLAHILRARQLHLPVSGNDKLATLQSALAQRNAALPISHVLHQTGTPVALWIAS